MTIQHQEIFLPEEQAVRVILRNSLGHIVHDLKEPLVKTIEKDGALVHIENDIDAVISGHIAMHEERHAVFVKAAQKRGHIAAEVQPVAVSVAEKDCGCGT